MDSFLEKYEKLVKEWQDKKIKTEVDLDLVLSNFRILFAYNSNLIENSETTYHDTREIFENGKVINFTGDLRTLFEIQNQKECYEYLRPYIVKKTAIDTPFILEVHKRLMRGCYDEMRYSKGERPGTFKVNEFITGDNVGAYAKDVPLLIEDLCAEINEHNGDVLTAAAYLHLMFENIHPFADGNGRVGRALMNYYLMINDYPPCIIYNEDKKTYYMGLSVFDNTAEIKGFKQFIVEETLKTWDKYKCKSKEMGLKNILSEQMAEEPEQEDIEK